MRKNAEYIAEYKQDKKCVKANRKYWFVVCCVTLTILFAGWLCLPNLEFHYIGKYNKSMISNVDGFGFKNMMELTFKTQELSDQFMRDIAFKGMSFNNEKILWWEENLENYTCKLSKLKYDKSYEKFIHAHKEILRLQTEMIKKMKNGDSETSKNKTYQDIASYRRTTKDLINEAMYKNGVEYWYDNGVLQYNYRYY